MCNNERSGEQVSDNEQLLARIAELEAEAERLRRAADDDAEPLTDEWISEQPDNGTWLVKNGWLRIEWECSEYVIKSIADRGGWFVYVTVSTRGDVRALVAALGGAEREEQK